MLVNLSDVLTSEGRQTSMEVPLEMTCFQSRMGSFEIIDKSLNKIHTLLQFRLILY